jgi:hypothetical protein
MNNNGSNIPNVSSALAMNDQMLRQRQELLDANKKLIQVKDTIRNLFPDLDNEKLKDLFEYIANIYEPQTKFLEFEIAKLDKQLELQNPELSIEQVGQITQEIAEKAQSKREKYFETKKAMVLTAEQREDLKDMYRSLAKLLHSDVNSEIDREYMSKLAEYKATDNLDMIQMLYTKLVEKGLDIAVVFDQIKSEPTSDNLRQDIISVQNKVTELEKLKEFLVSTRGYDSKSFDDVQKDLESELDGLRFEKASLEKQLEQMVASQEFEANSSQIVAINQAPDELQKQETALSLENHIEKDKQDWQKAKTVLDRFRRDLMEGRFGVVTSNEDYFSSGLCYYNLNIKGQNFKFNASEDEIIIKLKRPKEVSIFLRDGFENSSLFSLKDHSYSGGASNKFTFQELFTQIKSEIKEYAGIDLDALYGDGSEPVIDQVESKPGLVASPAESGMEKQHDVWNPRNMGEAMICIQELKSVLDNVPGVIKEHANNSYVLQTNDKAIIIEFINDYSENMVQVQTRNIQSYIKDHDAFYHQSTIDSVQNLNIGYLSNNIFINDFDENGLTEESVSKVFQSLKNKLKEFGLDLDIMKQG